MDRERVAAHQQTPYREPIATTSSAIVSRTPEPRAEVRIASVLSTAGVSCALHVLIVGLLFWRERVSLGDPVVALLLGALRASRWAPWLSVLVFAAWIALAVRAHRREQRAGSLRARAIEGACVTGALALVAWLPWSDPLVSELAAVVTVMGFAVATVWSLLRKRPEVFTS